ncbi:hypothetical protein [Achromobacter sp. ACRQX]|uniref:hypothetical protein n=1 Tax=Achromobacter sp. ACRQX TaxID=2918181 RepID=UPI001EF38E8B|nr:hypothetical protein [Achromobacter sp. ACRQX]MCG7324261.1 hypothetical protein [Achromobacter sp. ACRQX]
MKDNADVAEPLGAGGKKSTSKHDAPSVNDVRPGTVTPQERLDAESRVAEEAESYENAARYSDGEMNNIERDQALKLRKIYADKGYRFVRGSVAMLFALLGVHLLFKAIFYSVYLATPHDNRPQILFEGITSDVWLALITAVTVNILGVFLFVIKNLFPAKSDS